jgi:hypothetical protein
MSVAPPSRLLALPKEIRLMIYDLLPITRHHTITLMYLLAPQEFHPTIVTKRMSGSSLLATCHQLQSELSAHTNLNTLALEPLRLVTDWRFIHGAAIKAILLCASHGPTKCPRKQKLQKMVSSMHTLNDDFYAHTELHDILRQHASAYRPLHVEIAVVCGSEVLGSAHCLEKSIKDFYAWVEDVGMIQRKGEAQRLHVVLRPVPVSEEVARTVEATGSFVDFSHSKEFWEGRTRVVDLGKRIELAEWKKCWEEGLW